MPGLVRTGLYCRYLLFCVGSNAGLDRHIYAGPGMVLLQNGCGAGSVPGFGFREFLASLPAMPSENIIDIYFKNY